MDDERDSGTQRAKPSERRGAIWTERALLALILGTLLATVNLLVAIHRQGTPAPRDEAKAAAAQQAPLLAEAGHSAPSQAVPDKLTAVEASAKHVEPAPPPEDPTKKALDGLTKATTTELSAAEDADRRAAALDSARASAEAESQKWRRREMLVRQQIAGLEARAGQLESAASELDAERDVLAKETDALKAALFKAERRQGFAVLPYKGPNGTWRRPIVLECTAGGVKLQPKGATFTPMDMSPLINPRMSPLVRTVAREMLHIQGADTPDGAPAVPYLVFLVRPNGVRPYYEARSCLEPLGIAFGYELIEQDLAVDIPDFDNLATWDGSVPLDLPIESAPRRKVNVAANSGTDRGDASGTGSASSPAASQGWPDNASAGRNGTPGNRGGAGDSSPEDFVWPTRGRVASNDSGASLPAVPGQRRRWGQGEGMGPAGEGAGGSGIGASADANGLSGSGEASGEVGNQTPGIGGSFGGNAVAGSSGTMGSPFGSAASGSGTVGGRGAAPGLTAEGDSIPAFPQGSGSNVSLGISRGGRGGSAVQPEGGAGSTFSAGGGAGSPLSTGSSGGSNLGASAGTGSAMPSDVGPSTLLPSGRSAGSSVGSMAGGANGLQTGGSGSDSLGTGRLGSSFGSGTGTGSGASQGLGSASGSLGAGSLASGPGSGNGGASAATQSAGPRTGLSASGEMGSGSGNASLAAQSGAGGSSITSGGGLGSGSLSESETNAAGSPPGPSAGADPAVPGAGPSGSGNGPAASNGADGNAGSGMSTLPDLEPAGDGGATLPVRVPAPAQSTTSPGSLFGAGGLNQGSAPGQSGNTPAAIRGSAAVSPGTGTISASPGATAGLAAPMGSASGGSASVMGLSSPAGTGSLPPGSTPSVAGASVTGESSTASSGSADSTSQPSAGQGGGSSSSSPGSSGSTDSSSQNSPNANTGQSGLAFNLPSGTTAPSSAPSPPGMGMPFSPSSSSSSLSASSIGGNTAPDSTSSSSTNSPSPGFSLGQTASPSSDASSSDDLLFPPPPKPVQKPGTIEVPFEIVVVCRRDDVLLHPGGYRLTRKVMQQQSPGKPSMLTREIMAMVRKRAIVDPLIRPKPKLRFLVETDGSDTFWAARRQLLFALPDWPTTLQVAGPQPARVFTKESW